MSEDHDAEPDPSNVITMLVATDLHVGYKEKHDIRGGNCVRFSLGVIHRSDGVHFQKHCAALQPGLPAAATAVLSSVL